MKKTLNKRIFAIITLIFVAICSIMPFTLRNNRVYADEVSNNISFTSSNIFIPFDTSLSHTPFLFNFSYSYISSSSTHKNVDFTFNVSYLDFEDELSSVTFDTITVKRYTSDTSFSTTEFNNTNSISILFSSSAIRWEVDFFGYFLNTNSSVSIVGFDLVIDSSFITDFLPYSLNIYGDSSTAFNYLKYSSSDTLYSLLFRFPSDYLFFDSRTYYFGSGADFDNGYRDGYNQGKNDGYILGSDDGYRNGYSNGYQEGKNEGFNLGIENANEYSFLGLLGAVVDAPIQALTGLLNFEILGFNMFNLFKGLITLSIILFVVRLIL